MKNGQNSAFRLIQGKAFASLIYIDSKMYNVTIRNDNIKQLTHCKLLILYSPAQKLQKKKEKMKNLVSRT